MIDHVSTYTTRFDAAKAFYLSIMKALGHGLVTELVTSWDPGFPTARVAAFGPNGRPQLWLIEKKEKHSKHHTGFEAKGRTQVQAFHAAGLEAGGTSDGPPGPRPHYGETYYGSFLLDPDGNSVEAVTHSPS
jgi:catechol 2,3-dioxygenase-like lactoylglutathione lyase family enzyme